MKKISENKNDSISWQFFVANKDENFINKSNITKILPSHRGDIKILCDGKSAMIKTDGLITSDQNIMIFLKTADCIPAILYWPKTGWFGLIHMGYDGLLLGLPKKLIRIIDKLDLPTDKMKIIFGPSICEKCYDHNGIKRKIKWRVLRLLCPKFASNNHQQHTFDLKSAYISQLEKLGIKKIQIDSSEQLCTNCNLKLSRHHKNISDVLITTIKSANKY